MWLIVLLNRALLYLQIEIHLVLILIDILDFMRIFVMFSLAMITVIVSDYKVCDTVFERFHTLF